MSTSLYIFATISFTTIGQIFLKKASLLFGNTLKRNIYLLVGYLLFCFSVYVSYKLMQLIQLKYFTIIMSLNYITVLYASKLFLNEKITKNKFIGTVIILIGIIIFTYQGDA